MLGQRLDRAIASQKTQPSLAHLRGKGKHHRELAARATFQRFLKTPSGFLVCKKTDKDMTDTYPVSSYDGKVYEHLAGEFVGRHMITAAGRFGVELLTDTTPSLGMQMDESSVWRRKVLAVHLSHGTPETGLFRCASAFQDMTGLNAVHKALPDAEALKYLPRIYLHT
eukprot:1274968-Karenia_brevis.AAC.1